MAWTRLKKLAPSPHAHSSAGGSGAAQRGRSRRWFAALAAPLLGFAGSAWAAHDLVLQHTGPTNATITSTATYTVKLDNTDPAFTDAATGVKLKYVYDPALASFTAPARFSNGSDFCTEGTPGTILCDLADIPHGTNNLTVEFDLYINGAGLVATYVNGAAINPTATVTSVDEQVVGNDSEAINTTIAAGTDLGVTLATSPASGGSLTSGSLWTHDIVVKNNGPLNTTNAKVTLVPPATGMQWVASSLPTGCAMAGANVECTVPGSFLKDATHSFPGLKAQATGAGGSSLAVTASVTSALPDNKSDNNQSSSSIAVTAGTDLALKLGKTGGTILAGNPSTITVTPTYTGDVPLNPTFTITIPSTLTVNTGTPPTVSGWSGCSWSGNTTLSCTTWNGSGVPGVDQPMGSVSFPVTGPAGTYNVSGLLTSASPEANIANNSATVPVPFATPTVDVTIAKSGPLVPHNQFTKGATVQYTVKLENPSSSNVGYWGVLSFAENAPSGLAVTSITTVDSGWTCAISGCSKTYVQATPLARNSSVTFTVTAEVTDETKTTPLVNNVCRAAFTHPLVGTENAQVCASAGQVTGHPVADGTDLAIAKKVVTTAADIKAGDWLAYEIEMHNVGQAATNANMTDTLDNLATGIGSPAASFQITAIPGGWTCKNGATTLNANDTVNAATVNLSCEAASFPVCTAGTDCPKVAFQVRPMGSTADGTNRARTNTAVISSDTPEANFDNNTTTVISQVKAKTDFTISKVVSNGWDGSPPGTTPGKTGTELQYTVTVTNAGGSSGASNVIVTDVLPENVTYLGIQGSDLPSCTGVAANAVTASANKTLTCTWGTFPSTATRTFIVRIRPNNEWQGKTLVNDVYVNVDPATPTTQKAGTTEESSYSNNHGSASAKAGEADIDLAVAKRDTTDPVMVGADVDYEVTIVNNGPSVATHATIYDYLPVKGFTWNEDSIRFFKVKADGTRGTEILAPEQLTLGMSCSKQPDPNAYAKGGEDKTQPNKLNWLWPMNVTGNTTTNPNYVNGQWDDRISDNADIICNMGTLPKDGKRMLVYTLHAQERGVYMNHAIVRAQEHIDRKAQNFADAVWNNDAIQHRTTVRSVPDVDLVKQVSQSTVSLRELFTYTITVTNKLTAEPAHAPQVRDALPANMELTGAPTLTTGTADLTGGAFACNAPPTAPDVLPAVGSASKAGDTAFVCTLGTGVKEGANVVITVPVRVIGGGPVTLTNTATLHLDTDLTFDNEPSPVKNSDVPVAVLVSSIAGYVYHDADNDGVRGSGAGISGVTVTLTGVDAYGQPIAPLTATTAVDGAYKFDNLAPGTYTVTETHPNTWVDGKDTVGVFGAISGSGTASNDVIRSIALPADTHGTEYNFGELKQLTGGQTTATISGHVYHDANNDGVKDASEAPIAGVTITLTGPSGDVRTQVTDSSGFYEFTGLEPGVEYTVAETQPAAWTDGKDTAGTVHNLSSATNDKFVVTPVSGGNGLNWNFGEQKTTTPPPPPPPPSDPKGSIGCSVFDDLDQNGVRDAGESGIAGVTIRLLNAQNQQVASTVTAADGSYSFANQPVGTYTVVQETPAGYSPTTLVQRQVQVQANQNSAACFGVTTKPRPGSIGCSVFDDANQNGTHDADEKGLGGVTIRLFNDKDEEVASTTTAADGSYSFADLAPGTYKVSQVLPEGYSNTTPVERSTTVLSGKKASACFGVLPAKAKPGSVGCSVFDDADKNGQRDPGEGGLAGVTVRLRDAGGKLLSTTTSASDGTYGFPDLAPGSYTVETDLPTGYSPTGSTSRKVTVAAGADVSACFGAVGKPGALIVVKTLYEGWNAGAACGTSVAKKELLIVEKIATMHDLTWCFAVTNQGSKHLGAPVWEDSAYPGMVATAKAGTSLPLAPGATGTWYYQAKHNSSVLNIVGVEMPVTDPTGKPIPDEPPAKSSDDGKATFGMIYDPPYGVKVGSVDGADIINWTMVWVNDNIIAANNVYVSDTVKAPMEFVPGSLSCVGEGATSVVPGTCQYAAATKTVSVRGNFAADFGKTVVNASHRLFISFKVKVPKTEGPTSYENQGTASWTPPGSTDPIDTVTVFVPGVKIDPIDPKNPTVPVVNPPPGVGGDDPSIGHPGPGNPGTDVETPVVMDPDGPPPPPPPPPPEPPKPPPPPPVSIPTLSEWGLIVLSCLVGLIAVGRLPVARRW